MVSDEGRALLNAYRQPTRWWPLLLISVVIGVACVPLQLWAGMHTWTCSTDAVDAGRLMPSRIAWVVTGLAVAAPFLGAAAWDRRHGHRGPSGSKALVGLLIVTAGLGAATAVVPIRAFCW